MAQNGNGANVTVNIGVKGAPFRKPLPRPEPRSFSIPAVTRIGSKKLEGQNVFLWKPYTIRAPFLGTLMLVTALFIVVIELIVQKGKRDGALLFAEKDGELSSRQIFVSQYMGTILAVLYSIMIGLVDFDVKRLEPYFQLSNPHGALGKDSLLLKYPVEFLAFVPISALRRRHWSVFCIGLSMVFTFWALTPLQSSLLSNGSVARTKIAPGQIASGIHAAEPTVPLFLFNTYAQSWLGSENNEFTTREYAALPFNIPDSQARDQQDIWWGLTTVYYADLDCSPAKRADYSSREESPLRNSSTPYPMRAWTSPQRNCSFGHIGYSVGFPGFYPYYGIWVGYSSSTATSYFLQDAHICNLPPEETNLFLFLFSKQASPKADHQITATYCTTRYMSQQAQVAVTAQHPHAVKSVDLIGSPHGLSYEEFNSTFFETIIDSSSGFTDASSGPFGSTPKDFAHTQSIRAQFPTFGDTPAMPYVVAEQRDLNMLVDEKQQVEAIRKGFKHLFANYVASHLLSNETLPINLTQTFQMDAVVVEPIIGRILEGFLSAVLVLLVALFCLENKRKLNLLSDPSSITHTMSLVSESHELLHDLDGLDRASSDDIKSHLANVNYKLGRWKDNKYRLDRFGSTQVQRYNSQGAIGNEPLVHSLELGATVGVGFVFFLAAVLILLCVLFHSNTVYQGLPTLSNNNFVVQIIFSFIPTIIATGLEPFWVLLCRRFAMIQPFSNLAERNSAPSVSLSVKFTSVPPALVFSSAFRKKQYFLGTIASMCLIANLLAIAFGGLFNLNDSVHLPQEIKLRQNISIEISAVPASNMLDVNSTRTTIIASDDHNYIAWANATNGTPLPPWITPKYFFLPFSAGKNVTTGSVLKGRTVGYGVEATCALHTNPKVLYDLAQATFSYSLQDPTTSQACFGNYTEDPSCGDCGPGSNSLFGWDTKGALSHEIYPVLNATRNHTDFKACLTYFIGTWIHSPWNISKSISPSKMQTVLCEPKFISGEFDVTIDENSRILDYSPHGEIKVNDASKISNGNRPLDLLAGYSNILHAAVLNQGAVDAHFGPHKNPVATDWNSQWMTHFLNSTDLLNPNTTLPDSQDLSLAMKQTYEFLFPVILGLNYQQTFASSPVREFDGSMLVLAKRMQMSKVMFVLSVCVLGIYLLVGIYIYGFRTKPFLPRYPNSLGSILAFFYDSKVLDDIRGTELLSTRQRNALLERTRNTYGYGQLRGRDGKVRLGIDKEPLVGAARPTTPKPGKRWWIF